MFSSSQDLSWVSLPMKDMLLVILAKPPLIFFKLRPCISLYGRFSLTLLISPQRYTMWTGSQISGAYNSLNFAHTRSPAWLAATLLHVIFLETQDQPAQTSWDGAGQWQGESNSAKHKLPFNSCIDVIHITSHVPLAKAIFMPSLPWMDWESRLFSQGGQTSRHWSTVVQSTKETSPALPRKSSSLFFYTSITFAWLYDNRGYYNCLHHYCKG